MARRGDEAMRRAQRGGGGDPKVEAWRRGFVVRPDSLSRVSSPGYRAREFARWVRGDGSEVLVVATAKVVSGHFMTPALVEQEPREGYWHVVVGQDWIRFPREIVDFAHELDLAWVPRDTFGDSWWESPHVQEGVYKAYVGQAPNPPQKHCVGGGKHRPLIYYPHPSKEGWLLEVCETCKEQLAEVSPSDIHGYDPPEFKVEPPDWPSMNPGPDERLRQLQRHGDDPIKLAQELLRHGRQAELAHAPVSTWNAVVDAIRRGELPEEALPLPPGVQRMTSAEIENVFLAALRLLRHGRPVRVEAWYRPGHAFIRGRVVDWPHPPEDGADGYVRARFYVGQSTGQVKVLLHLDNARSNGGPQLDPGSFVSARLLTPRPGGPGRTRWNPPWSPEELERRAQELREDGHGEAMIRLILRREVRTPKPGGPWPRERELQRRMGGQVVRSLIEQERAERGPWLANPDEDIRRLERAASLGDKDAAEKLEWVKLRGGQFPSFRSFLRRKRSDRPTMATYSWIDFPDGWHLSIQPSQYPDFWEVAAVEPDGNVLGWYFPYRFEGDGLPEGMDPANAPMGEAYTGGTSVTHHQAQAMFEAMIERHGLPVRSNPDEPMRELERRAALGDQEAQAKLEAAQVRAGMRPPRVAWVADLVKEIEQELPRVEVSALTPYVDRAHIAAGIRAVLKAAGVKGVSITTPRWAWASSIQLSSKGPISPSSLRAINESGLTSPLPWSERAVSEPYGFQASLYPRNKEDRSDPMSDYFQPGGPQLIEPYWEIFKSAVRASIAKAGGTGRAATRKRK